MKLLSFLLIGSIFFFTLFSCEQDELVSSSSQESIVSVTINNLNDQADTTWYEAWLLPKEASSVDSVISLGLLEKQADGTYTTSSSVKPGFLQAAENVVVTMEQDNVEGRIVNTDGSTTIGPSSYRILAGEILANEGSFSIGHSLILDFDFNSAIVNYIIDTPTDPQSIGNKAGIWFTNIDTTNVFDTLGNLIQIDTTYSSSLDLPVVPAGWMYEALLVSGSDTLSLGIFTDPGKADNSAAYVGANAAHPFPGEDFIQNAPNGLTFPLNVTGKELIIMITPRYPGKSIPYLVEAFKGTIASDASVKTKLDLPLNLSAFPTGELSIELNLY